MEENVWSPLRNKGLKLLYLGLEVPLELQDEQVVHLPLTKTEPLSFCLPRPPSFYSHLILTSPRAVRYFCAQEDVKGFQTIISIGPKTSAELPKGLHLIEAEKFSQEGIIDLMETQEIKAIVYPRSRLSRPLIDMWCREKEIPLDVIDLYDTYSLKRDLENLSEYDYIVMTSPSSVKSFFDNYRKPVVNLNFFFIGHVTKGCFDQIANKRNF